MVFVLFVFLNKFLLGLILILEIVLLFLGIGKIFIILFLVIVLENILKLEFFIKLDIFINFKLNWILGLLLL